MAANIDKVSAKISALEESLDELEAQLEPLFAQTLSETIVGLENIQQAKLQVALPYLVYDLIFIYLKTKGVDPKTHPVIAELDRVRQYFGKIKDAEDPAKRKLAVDKNVASRFIKHAIAQVKYGRPPGQDEGMPSQPENTRVPVKVTEKMVARAQYEKELRELGSEEEEDLDIIDDTEDQSMPDTPSAVVDKGKGKALTDDILADVAQAVTGQKRRRATLDPFAGYGDEQELQLERRNKSAKSSPDTSRASKPRPSAGTAKAQKATKKAKSKAKQHKGSPGS
ncbi:hypothetical protein BC835DRAFT_1388170 [Cytidiella melzeri]|nr:hypothetical protein BC835DRAFT_1388170 [Cytidiella melzeri]